MKSLNELIVRSDQSIRDAMNTIARNERGICFVVEVDNILIGVITDGDLRRALLKGHSLDSNIKEAININFISLHFSSQPDLIRRTFTKTLKLIPLCDEAGKLVDVADFQRSHRIPLLEPDLTGRELEYVRDCIETNWISSQGNYVHRFEAQFEEMHSGMHAIAVSNGTVALHLALHGLGIGSGDEVIVPNFTFAATINAVLYCQATPVLCEIDPLTMCIDVGEAEKLISSKTKAIIPVHLYGQSCDMDAILSLSQRHNLLTIEDCAEAIGSTWKEKPVGMFGDASIFSFFGNKTISTGEGGMVLIKNLEIYKQARILRDHGMHLERKYWHEHVGFNYRLTNLQAAIGVAQMERLNQIVKKKRKIADLYSSSLNELAKVIQLPTIKDQSIHSNWLYTVILRHEVDRDQVLLQLLEAGIEARAVFYPLNQMPPYNKFKTSENVCHSIRASRSGISLPSSVSLIEEEINYVADMLKNILKFYD